MACSDLPSFSAWIVGGALEEAESLGASFERWPELRNLHAIGRLVLWGRVAPDALAEIYSRSTVVAMPSRREAFGLVAVQAMLSGTPVVASEVGGLRNTVVPRRTGLLIQPGDASALAFALSSMVRHRNLARWLGSEALAWAKSLFSDQSEHGGFSRIIACQNGLDPGWHPLEDPGAFFAAEHARFVRSLLGADAELEWIPSDHNSLFRVQIGERAIVAKRFTDRPDLDASIYRLPAGMRASGRLSRVSRSLAVGECPVALSGLAAGDGVLLFDPCEEARSMMEDEIIAVADRLAVGPPIPRQESLAACRSSIEALAAQPSWEALNSFDRAAGILNAPLSGDEAVFVRCHPLAEMVRLKLHLDSGAWPLSSADASRFGTILDQCSVQESASAPRALLRHGDLSARHVLACEGRLLLSDLEQARFAFGELDRAGLAVEIARTVSGRDLDGAVSALARAAATADTFAWVVCELLHRSLGRGSWGRSGVVAEALTLCEAFLARVTPR